MGVTMTAATKPVTKRRKTPKPTQPTAIDQAGEVWKCEACGARVPDHTPTCACGVGKPGLDYPTWSLLKALEPSAEFRDEWAGLRCTGAADSVIISTATAAFRRHRVNNNDDQPITTVWSLDLNASVDVWFAKHGDVEPDEMPRRKPDLAAKQLANRIRLLYAIPKPPAPGKSRAKVPRRAADNRPSAQGTPAENGQAATGDQVESIAIGKITVPKDTNPRKHFDDEAMQRLVESIKLDGIIQPLTVRPAGKNGYELLAGERRLRAAKTAKLKTVPAIVKVVDDATAARIRLVENFIREDLNPIEEAAAFRELLDGHGFSQRQLAEDLNVSQAKIANAVRLLKLPKVWQQRVISREITTKQARSLATWAEREAVMVEFDAVLKEWGGLKRNADRLDQILRNALEQATRPLTGEYRDTKAQGYYQQWKPVRLSKKDREREDLDVVDLSKVSYGLGKRAFNVALWTELQKAGEKRATERADRTEKRSKSKAKAEPKLTPAEKARRTKDRREAWQKKLYRWKLRWLQGRIVELLPKLDNGRLMLKFVLYFASRDDQYAKRRAELSDAIAKAGGKRKTAGYHGTDVWASLSTLDLKQLPEAGGAALVSWLQHEFEGWRCDLEPKAIEGIAQDLGVDVAKDWTLTSDFLELHSKDQLAELAKEWKVELRGTKRAEIIENLLADAANKKAPKELVKLKPISL